MTSKREENQFASLSTESLADCGRLLVSSLTGKDSDAKEGSAEALSDLLKEHGLETEGARVLQLFRMGTFLKGEIRSARDACLRSNVVGGLRSVTVRARARFLEEMLTFLNEDVLTEEEHLVFRRKQSADKALSEANLVRDDNTEIVLYSSWHNDPVSHNTLKARIQFVREGKKRWADFCVFFETDDATVISVDWQEVISW